MSLSANHSTSLVSRLVAASPPPERTQKTSVSPRKPSAADCRARSHTAASLTARTGSLTPRTLLVRPLRRSLVYVRPAARQVQRFPSITSRTIRIRPGRVEYRGAHTNLRRRVAGFAVEQPLDALPACTGMFRHDLAARRRSAAKRSRSYGSLLNAWPVCASAWISRAQISQSGSDTSAAGQPANSVTIVTWAASPPRFQRR